MPKRCSPVEKGTPRRAVGDEKKAKRGQERAPGGMRIMPCFVIDKVWFRRKVYMAKATT